MRGSHIQKVIQIYQIDQNSIYSISESYINQSTISAEMNHLDGESWLYNLPNLDTTIVVLKRCKKGSEIDTINKLKQQYQGMSTIEFNWFELEDLEIFDHFMENLEKIVEIGFLRIQISKLYKHCDQKRLYYYLKKVKMSKAESFCFKKWWIGQNSLNSLRKNLERLDYELDKEGEKCGEKYSISIEDCKIWNIDLSFIDTYYRFFDCPPIFKLIGTLTDDNMINQLKLEYSDIYFEITKRENCKKR